MQRVFIKQVGRFKVGEKRDYPLPTWTQLAASAKMPLSEFTRTDDELISRAMSVKGNGK